MSAASARVISVTSARIPETRRLAGVMTSGELLSSGFSGKPSCAGAGFGVVHFTWRELTTGPGQVIGWIMAAFERAEAIARAG
jgi:hypothetical protein